MIFLCIIVILVSCASYNIYKNQIDINYSNCMNGPQCYPNFDNTEFCKYIHNSDNIKFAYTILFSVFGSIIFLIIIGIVSIRYCCPIGSEIYITNYAGYNYGSISNIQPDSQQPIIINIKNKKYNNSTNTNTSIINNNEQ